MSIQACCWGRVRSATLTVGAAWIVVACGGGSPASAPESPPADVAPEQGSPAAPPAKAEPKEPAVKPAPSEEELEAQKLAEAERRRQGSAPKEREVVYRVTPEGLAVEVDGVRFKPSAKPVKKANGGYAIAISVQAEATDDQTHFLLSPENGPLSFAAKIFDKNGAQVAHHSDHRSGEDSQFITPDGRLMLSREWPSGSVKGPLWWGQKVTLHVGLWGLGTSAENTRPLNKFFVVEMVGGAKPQAIITPPEL